MTLSSRGPLPSLFHSSVRWILSLHLKGSELWLIFLQLTLNTYPVVLSFSSYLNIFKTFSIEITWLYPRAFHSHYQELQIEKTWSWFCTRPKFVQINNCGLAIWYFDLKRNTLQCVNSSSRLCVFLAVQLKWQLIL